MKHIYIAVLQRLYQTSPDEAFDGCHKHRIIPGYEGGTYDENNVVFLTQKQHCLAHWLRWKLLGDLRDKRSYKMVGVGPSGLSYEDRVDHGIMCCHQKIGIHGLTFEEKQRIGNKTYITQKETYLLTNKKNFYYWSTKEGRSERAKLGGTASYTNNTAFVNQQASFKDKEYARIQGSKAGKKPATNGKINKRFKTEDDRAKFIMENAGWKIGTTRKLKLVK